MLVKQIVLFKATYCGHSRPGSPAAVVLSRMTYSPAGDRGSPPHGGPRSPRVNVQLESEKFSENLQQKWASGKHPSPSMKQFGKRVRKASARFRERSGTASSDTSYQSPWPRTAEFNTRSTSEGAGTAAAAAGASSSSSSSAERSSNALRASRPDAPAEPIYEGFGDDYDDEEDEEDLVSPPLLQQRQGSAGGSSARSQSPPQSATATDSPNHSAPSSVGSSPGGARHGAGGPDDEATAAGGDEAVDEEEDDEAMPADDASLLAPEALHRLTEHIRHFSGGLAEGVGGSGEW